jgi:hypothetical protein
MSGKPQVAIRLGTDGKAQVKQDFQEIGDAGDATATRLQRRFEQQSQATQAAMAQQAATAAKLAAIQPQTAMQMQVSQAVGTGFGADFEGSARRSALAMKDLLAQEDALTQRAETLRRAVDPLYAAQQRYDTEIREANTLLAAGRIGQDVHTAAVTASQLALARAKKELDGHTSSLGLNRMQAITAQSAVLRFTDAILAGRSPLTAFALEAHKGAEVLSLDDGGMAGGLAKVGALITPVSIGIAAVAAVTVAGGIAWYNYAAALAKLDAAAQGTGRILGETGQQLEDNARTAAAAANISVGSAEQIETAYLPVAKSRDVLVGLTAVTKDFAAATSQDLGHAQQELAGDFGNTIAGAQDLASKYGVLNQAQVERIAKLVEEGDLQKAQKQLLVDIQGAFDGASHHADGLAGSIHNIGVEAQNAWHWLGKMLDQYGWIAVYATNAQAGLALAPGGGRAPNAGAAPGNQAMSGAMALVRGYQGDDRSQIQSNIGTIRSAMALGGTPQQLQQLTQLLEANEHALQTWIPAQQKKIELDQLAARAAAAKTPAEKQAVAAERQRLELAGQVVTYADAQAQATAKGAQAAEQASKKHDKHAESLAREAAAMGVDTEASLKLAEGYLQMGASEIVLEARRKAMTDATKKGIDVEAQVRRQVALAVAEGAATQAKAVGQLREQNAVRADVNDQVAAGTLAAADYNQALHDEDALRPLLKLKLVAHGEALQIVTELIKAQTDALRKQHEEEARAAALTATDAALRGASDTLALMQYAGDPQARALAAARLAAQHEADDKHFVGDDRTNFLRARSDEAQANLASQRADFVAKTLDDQRDGIALTERERELQLVAANDNYRQAELDKLRMILELKKEGIDPESAQGKAILANVAAYDAEQAKLKQLTANMQELKGFGDQFLDDFLNPDNWTNWHDFALKMLKDIEAELIKLSLLNPLKNWLLGEHNPTGSSIFGLIGKLLGGTTGGSPISVGDIGPDMDPIDVGDIPAFAAGTDSAPGGLALVGEKGPELENLPRGAGITPAAETRRLLAQNDSGIGSLTFNMPIYAPGADPAALARLQNEVRDLKRSLPMQIVTTVADARRRRIF